MTSTTQLKLQNVTTNGTTIGAIVPTPQRTWQGWLLTADGHGYVPVQTLNNPEFSLPSHAREAVVSEHQKRVDRAANAPSVFDIGIGDIVAITGHKGGEDVITVHHRQEHNTHVTLTDETGYQYELAPGARFRFVLRA